MSLAKCHPFMILGEIGSLARLLCTLQHLAKAKALILGVLQRKIDAESSQNFEEVLDWQKTPQT